MNPSSSRTVLVTGASRGIGRAIALRLAADGFRVVVHYAGNQAAAADTVAAIASQGGSAVTLRADLTDAEQAAVLFEAAGPLAAVVHNAGAMSLAPIAPENVGVFDQMVATNLRASFLVLGHAARVLGEGGRIVALSSSAIAKSLPGYGAYSAAKAGVEALVHVLANELRGRGITVNAVAPGPVATELFLQGKTAEQIEQFRTMPPLERLGEPEDIARVVSFLVGPDGGWVHGQVLRANGGFA